MAAAGPDEAKDSIGATWDAAAPHYDQGWAHGLHTAEEKAAWARLLERLLGPAGGLRVLDAGCGTGFLALLLAEAGHTVTGIDISEGMVAEARRRAAERGLDASFGRGDAEAPPAGLGTFDAVVSRHLLWTLVDPDAAVRAWSRLLVDGGQVIAIDGFWTATRPRDRLAERLARLLERFSRREGGHDGGYTPEVCARMPLFGLDRLDPAVEVFRRAGLAAVSAEMLDDIDRVERSAMPWRERLRLRHRRYVVRGRRPGGAVAAGRSREDG